MLSLKRVRQLIPDPNLSDEQLLEIRDQFSMLAEIIFEKWQQDRKKAKMDFIKRDV